MVEHGLNRKGEREVENIEEKEEKENGGGWWYGGWFSTVVR